MSSNKGTLKHETRSILKRLHIKNFKPLKDVELDFSLLSIILGENTSGKSAVIQSIITLSNGYLEEDLSLIATSRNSKKVISIKADFFGEFGVSRLMGDSQNFITITNPSLIYSFSSTGTSGEIAFNKINFYFQQIKREYVSDIFANKLFLFGLRGVRTSLLLKNSYRKYVDQEIIDIITKLMNEIGLGEKIDFLGSTSESNPSLYSFQLDYKYRQSSNQLQVGRFTVVFHQLIPNISVIDPLRSINIRAPNIANKIPAKSTDRKTTDKLLSYFHYSSRPEIKENLIKIIKWAEEFEIFKLESIPEENLRTRLQFIDKTYSTRIDVTDGGSGIGQLLYLIVECVLAEPGDLLLIDEPEVHLHAKFQAKVVDLFLETVERKVQLIIATHSEYFLLRLQRRISEGVLSPENVSIIELKKNKNKNYVTHHKLDENGQYKGLPPEVIEFATEEYQSWTDAMMKRGKSD